MGEIFARSAEEIEPYRQREQQRAPA